ncbi:MAG: NERD domain-containing protein [Oscillospiraceae bacterium]|nr:NERD domain-containing protein [Oscillospiraceae bacterium]
MLYIALGILAVAVIVFALVLYFKNARTGDRMGFFDLLFTPEHKLAGMNGEKAVQRIVETVLREDDRLVTNVQIESDGKPAEMDCVVVNKYGVFVIEVKNYSRYIVGGEDDYEWVKYKTSRGGNTYEKTVKNPIKQVKRQVWILARYLDYYGLNAWVEGYAILLQDNSPVESQYILNSAEEIDRAIHTASRRMLDAKTVESIYDLLK